MFHFLFDYSFSRDVNLLKYTENYRENCNENYSESYNENYSGNYSENYIAGYRENYYEIFSHIISS